MGRRAGTDRGKDYLQSIIFDALRESSVIYPTSLYSGLSLLDKIPRENARQALEEQKRLLDEEFCALEKGEKTNEAAGREVPQISRITIENMFAIIRQQQQFIEKILEVLED